LLSEKGRRRKKKGRKRWGVDKSVPIDGHPHVALSSPPEGRKKCSEGKGGGGDAIPNFAWQRTLTPD